MENEMTKDKFDRLNKDSFANELANRFTQINQKVDRTYTFDIITIIGIIFTILEWLFGWSYSKQDIVTFNVGYIWRKYLTSVVNRKVKDLDKSKFIIKNLPMFLATLTCDELDKAKDLI